jgi:hypothetical protein
MRTTLIAAFIVALGGPAFAQSSSVQPPTSGIAAPPNQGGQAVRDRLVQNLKQSGFQDIRVQPESFLVRAKDKDGDPVMMVINPDSMTEIVGNTVGRSSSSNGSSQYQNSGANSSPTNATPNQSDH